MFVLVLELYTVRPHYNVTCLYRDNDFLQYGNFAKLHVLQGLELTALRQFSKFIFFYRDWNCLHYGNIAMLHVFTGTVTVCSTKTLQSYIFLQGLELSALR